MRERQHSFGDFFDEVDRLPGPAEAVAPAHSQRASVHLERRPLHALRGVYGEVTEHRRLRQPALSGYGEAEGRGVTFPGQRDPAAVPARDTGALVSRVLAEFVGDLADLWRPSSSPW